MINGLTAKTLPEPYKKVFFSYKNSDAAALITQINSSLQSDISKQFDKSALVPGRSWKNQLESFIIESDVFVFVVSKGSVESFSEKSSFPICAWEVECAIKNNIDIIPLLWEEPLNVNLLPEVITSQEWEDFSGFRLSGFRDEEKFELAWDKLVNRIHYDKDLWNGEKMDWFRITKSWVESKYKDEYLLDKMEMEELELFLRRTPHDLTWDLDNKDFRKYIRMNRIKWNIL